VDGAGFRGFYGAALGYLGLECGDVAAGRAQVTPVDGEVVIESSNVDFMQVVKMLVVVLSGGVLDCHSSRRGIRRYSYGSVRMYSDYGLITRRFTGRSRTCGRVVVFLAEYRAVWELTYSDVCRTRTGAG
jgi:hypothetical protein